MTKQLNHLQEIDQLPHATIQILPLGEGANPALRGSFILLEFNDDYPDVLFVESPRGDTNVLEPDATKARRAVWNLVAEKHAGQRPLEYYVKRALDML